MPNEKPPIGRVDLVKVGVEIEKSKEDIVEENAPQAARERKPSVIGEKVAREFMVRVRGKHGSTPEFLHRLIELARQGYADSPEHLERLPSVDVLVSVLSERLSEAARDPKTTPKELYGYLVDLIEYQEKG